MARSHGKITAAIWNDPAWVTLDASAQRLYFLLLTQPKLNLAGCLDVLPTRWARLATDTTVDDIGQALAILEAANFIATDADTDELVIRTFVRHDITQGGWNRNIAKGLWSAWQSISSEHLRHCVIAHLPDHIWEKDHGVTVPSEAQEMRCRSWVPVSSEPQVHSRLEPQMHPRFEPPSTVYPLPSPVASLQRDVPLQATPERLAALNQATELVMVGLDKLTAPATVRNPSAWVAKARSGIRAELEKLQAELPDATAAELASAHSGIGQPLLPARVPAAVREQHYHCPPPCDGHGNVIHDDDTVTPNGCPGQTITTEAS